jgi:EAL domain-containing protein (putative c-di-GMP-specific phosphodiesterase class I)
VRRRHAALTYAELEEVPDDARAFEQCGKMFLLRPVPELKESLAEAVESAGAMCSQFTLEITETGIVEYGPDALEILVRMRIKGFGLSVDDFGTGHSSLAYLRKLLSPEQP